MGERDSYEAVETVVPLLAEMSEGLREVVGEAGKSEGMDGRGVMLEEGEMPGLEEARRVEEREGAIVKDMVLSSGVREGSMERWNQRKFCERAKEEARVSCGGAEGQPRQRRSHSRRDVPALGSARRRAP